MKNIIILLIPLLLFSCKSKVENDFDEIIHYSINDEKAINNEQNFEFIELYNGLESKDRIEINFENKLTEFGFTKNKISKENISKINHSLANDLNLKYDEVACVPMYRDILILKKNGNVEAMIKICFECKMNLSTGKINSNFDCENSDNMSNYDTLNSILYK